MMPLPYRHLTSVLLRREGDLFLFDGGEGTQVSLRRLNLKWKKINAIFVSHTHADHVTGLPGIMMLSSQIDRDDPLYIYGPPKIAEYIETSRKVLDMYINYPVIVKEITEPGIVHQGEDFYIRAFPLQHTKTCVGYTLEELPRPMPSPANAFTADGAGKFVRYSCTRIRFLQNSTKMHSLQKLKLIPRVFVPTAAFAIWFVRRACRCTRP